MVKISRSKKMRELAAYKGLKQVNVASLDLPCGFTCPMASECQAFADRETGKITDGDNCKFRCYGTSLEAVFKNTRALHWHNYDAVINAKTSGSVVDAIAPAITPKVKIMRVHSFGDFFNRVYFQGWLDLAEKFSDIIFFAYTKVLPYLDVAKPDNFSMVYSYGGKLDHKLANQPYARVVDSVEHAERLGLPVACQANPADDFDFIRAGQSFALVIHGTQPKNAIPLEGVA